MEYFIWNYSLTQVTLILQNDMKIIQTHTYLKKELKSYNSQEIFCIFSKTPDGENNSEFVNVIYNDM